MLLNKFYKLNKRKLLVEDMITVRKMADFFMTTTIIIMVMILTVGRRGCGLLVFSGRRHPKMYPLDPYLGPTIPLGLAGGRPALA